MQNSTNKSHQEGEFKCLEYLFRIENLSGISKDILLDAVESRKINEEKQWHAGNKLAEKQTFLEPGDK